MDDVLWSHFASTNNERIDNAERHCRQASCPFKLKTHPHIGWRLIHLNCVPQDRLWVFEAVKIRCPKQLHNAISGLHIASRCSVNWMIGTNAMTLCNNSLSCEEGQKVQAFKAWLAGWVRDTLMRIAKWGMDNGKPGRLTSYRKRVVGTYIIQLQIQCMGRPVLDMVAGDFQSVLVWTWDDSAGKMFLLFAGASITRLADWQAFFTN